MKPTQSLGIDVGATGIKAAIIDHKSGELVSEKYKLATPKPATPDAMLGTVQDLITSLDWFGKPVGFGFPSIVKNGVVLSASNIDPSWINYPIVEKWSAALQTEINVINDADAAGLAEIQFGNPLAKKGFVIFLTLGTGLGSGIFLDGKLIPNSEFGQMYYKKGIAEKYVSNSAREQSKMSWASYGKALNEYLKYIEFIFNPNLIILGGGISKKFDKYSPQFTFSTPIEASSMYNNAGIIGAAMACERDLEF